MNRKEEMYNIKIQIRFYEYKIQKNIIHDRAGISVFEGIPDLRSNTGLFKQFQNKYNLSSQNFYKNFNLSKENVIISHKFMNFLTNKI